MPTDPSMPAQIVEAASRWFADRDSGLPVDEAAFRQWLEADPRHWQVYQDMERLWSDLGHVAPPLTVGASIRPLAGARRRGHARRIPSARPRRLISVAVAASLVVLMIGTVQDWPMRLRADVMTGTGEQRMVDLADGSRIRLNTSSAVAIDMDRGHRIVRLLKGEASFEVAPDRHRPFRVEAAGGSTTALGTRFVIRSEKDGVRVIVTEHRVRVAYKGGSTRQIILGEGRAVTYGPASGLGRPEAVNGADAEAWTEGLLVFEDRPLGQVVAELARYHRGYMRVVGRSVAERRVSGVFRVDDPVGAVDKLQHALNLRTARLTDRLILLF